MCCLVHLVEGRVLLGVLALALLVVTVLALEDLLAVLVKLESGDHDLRRVDGNHNGLAWRERRGRRERAGAGEGETRRDRGGGRLDWGDGWFGVCVVGWVAA